MRESKKYAYRWDMVRYALTFFVALLVMTGVLLTASLIPNNSILTNMEDSARYIRGKEQVEYIIPGVFGTQLHYSADATWLSIAYGFDPDHPLESTLWANYYAGSGGLCKSFADQVENHYIGNTQYLRYWHGAAAVLRFFHLGLNVHQIYMLHEAMMGLLFTILVWMLWKNGFIAEVLSLGFALLMVSAWVVPLCLEYVWIFLIMFAVSIIAIRMALQGRYDHACILFLVTGMVTIFLDFLTTETLTLLIPLLFMLRIYSVRHEDSKEMWRLAVKASIAWLAGYCGMWAMKWVIASLVLHQNVMPFVQEHIEERLGGSVGLSLPEYLLQAIIRNVQRLAFYDYGIYGAAAVFILLVLLMIPVFTGRVSLREKINWIRIGLYAVLMMIPYLRYLVLHNHSYGHFCFTYRAQAASILALCFIILELVQFNPRKAVIKNA